MALKWTNKAQVDQMFAKMQAEYDRKSIEWLASIGERVVKYAREDSSPLKHYTDRTGNLRNSIGYVIIQNGSVVLNSFGPSKPQQLGLSHALEVASSLKGYKTYLVWAAGMEYARYVEARGFDVIQGSGDWVEANVQSFRDEFKRYLLTKK